MSGVRSFTEAEPILRIKEPGPPYNLGSHTQACSFDGDLGPEPAQADAVPPCQTVDHAEGGGQLGPHTSQCFWDPAL